MSVQLDDRLTPRQLERLARYEARPAGSTPSWSYLHIEKVSRFEPFFVLVFAVTEVCVRWWEKYVRRREDARG